MKIASLIPAALTIALSGSAVAGGFVGLGIGSPSRLQDDSGYFGPDGRSGKIFGGYRYPVKTGYLAVEGAYTGFSLLRGGYQKFDASTLALAGKYNHKLTDGFEAFGRIGVQHTSIEDMDPNIGGSYNLSGNGLLVGAGFEYHPPLKLPVDGAVYVDGNYTSTDLENDNGGGTSSSDFLFSLGLVVGF